MKSVLISIQPYWVFLIIAKKMGWDIDKEKTIEARKNFPKDKDWNKMAEVYCSKNKKSFNRIPKEYQPLMQKFLGKVVGQFYCPTYMDGGSSLFLKQSCLAIEEFFDYNKGNRTYGWRIADLKIYEKPKELSEFWTIKCTNKRNGCVGCEVKPNCIKTITRPPQSWFYVESLGE